jgi:hypothetical protein
VFSTTLATMGENSRLVRGDVAAEVEKLNWQPGGDLGVSGPGLASTLARLDLIDEYRMVISPSWSAAASHTSRWITRSPSACSRPGRSATARCTSAISGLDSLSIR